jgi:hypothetical protein
MVRKLLWIHSEVSEAEREARHGRTEETMNELVDVLLVTLGLLCAMKCPNIVQRMWDKITENSKRGHHHGGRRF